MRPILKYAAVMPQELLKVAIQCIDGLRLHAVAQHQLVTLGHRTDRVKLHAAQLAECVQHSFGRGGLGCMQSLGLHRQLARLGKRQLNRMGHGLLLCSQLSTSPSMTSAIPR